MSETYEIDDETMEMCRALEFYDEHRHFPFEKKKVMVSISYKTADKLKEKSKQLNKPVSLIVEESI